MIMSNGFLHAAEAIDLARIDAEQTRRRAELRDSRNREVVELGYLAVSTGQITQENLVDVTWNTIERHRRLMRALGYSDIEDEHRGNEMRVQSRPITILPDAQLILAQDPESPLRSKGFRQVAKDLGVEAALDDFADVRSTKIEIYDDHTERRILEEVLAPREFRSPDEMFREEWGGSFFPFMNNFAFDSPAIRTRWRGGQVQSDQKLSEKQLVVASGLNIRFNDMLDSVELAIS